MASRAIEYEFDPNPESRSSWLPISVVFYRFAELCMVTKSLTPGFSLKLSHFHLSPHSQHLFKTHALTRVSVTGDKAVYQPVNRVRAKLQELVFDQVDGDIFDLA